MTIHRSIATSALVLAVCLAATPVQAGTQTFDPGTIVTGNTQTPNTWYTDRYNPASFGSSFFDGDNRLKIEVAAADAVRESPYDGIFYSFQGRVYDTNIVGPKQIMRIDMFVSSNASMPINTGLWATGANAGGTILDYPTIVYRNPSSGVRGFYAFDGNPDPSANAYQLLMAIGDDDLDKWYNIGFELTTGVGVQYTINHANVGAFYSDTTTVTLRNAIINTYNNGDRTVYYDNFEAGIPEPASLSIVGLGAAALLLRRRRAAK